MDNTFDSALEGLEETGASPEAREIVELLARHGEEEGTILNGYQRFAKEVSAPEPVI